MTPARERTLGAALSSGVWSCLWAAVAFVAGCTAPAGAAEPPIAGAGVARPAAANSRASSVTVALGDVSQAGPNPADPDTSVERFLDTLADSTDSYFGITAAPVDTTGLDSARAWAFQNPMVENLKGSLRPSLEPWLEFNRVDGPVWGLGIAAGRELRTGRLGLKAGWAAGPNDVLGEATYTKRLGREGNRWTLRARGGRTTSSLNRSRGDSYLSTMRAFLNGADRTHYLRREGFGATVERQRPTHRVSVGWRDEREIPLETTATWNLFNRQLLVVDNLPASRGRAREFEFDALVRVPGTPVLAQVVHQTSSRSAGSDFEYRRTYLAAGADFGLSRWFALVPQLAYGRLSGEAIPQESFFIGGSRTLRSLESWSFNGTGMALARLDLIAIPDLLQLARIPHPDMFPIQGSVFLASGAAWGVDPFGGPTRPGIDWPNEEAWQSEAGFAFHYQPGIPDPQSSFRFSFGFGLGANHGSNFTMTYTRALDLIRGFSD